MEKSYLFQLVLLVLLLFTFHSLTAQKSCDKVHNEIKGALVQWNTACKNADLERVMSMFVDSDNIMVVGSADGEISKGKDEIREWVGQLFSYAGYSWKWKLFDGSVPQSE
jgi:ketosteroid isomerase-like protein